MEITTKQLKRVDVVTVSGRIDSSTAPALEEVLKSIVDADRFRICMDLSDLEYISSGGIKVLISTLKTCKRWNRGDLRLANISPSIAEVFDLAGLLPLFKIYPTLVEAVGSF
jgi:anti-sigma B factor antagonist